MLGVAAAFVLLAAACGDDDTADSTDEPSTEQPAEGESNEDDSTEDESTEDESGEGEPTEASGEPIKLMTIGPIEAPGFSLPSIPVGTGVAIDEINAAGGINGRPLELIACNDENDPNTAAQCVQQAVEEGVVAIVGGLTLFDVSVVPLLESEGIPVVGLTAASLFSSPNLFLIGGEGAVAFAGIGASLVQQGCANVAIVLSASAAPTNGPQIESGVVSEGGSVVTTLQAPEGGDWAPVVESAIDAGAECIAAGTGPPETGPLLAAMRARDESLPLAVAEGGLPDVVLAEVGELANGTMAMAPFPPPSAGVGVNAELAEKAQAAAPDVPYDTFAQKGYVAVNVTAEALQGLDDVSAEALLAALSTVTGFDTGLGATIDFSAPTDISGFESVYNPEIYLWVANGGTYELLQPDPIDLTEALRVQAGG